MAHFDLLYQNLLRDIQEHGIQDVNKRTGHETKAIPGAQFSIDLEKEGFPLLTLRKIPIQAFIAEQTWFISGSRKPADLLRDFTKIWDVFTNPGDVVTVAYGYRWRRHFGRDQLKLLIDLLKNDASSRHGVIVTWDPSSDGLGGPARKNVPCPFTFTVNIIGGRLHLHNIIRSNDIILGLPFDAAGFAFLACVLAQKLGVRPGIYTHSISNAHIYDNHYFAIPELLRRPADHPMIHLHLPEKSFERAEKKYPDLIREVSAHLEAQYHPGDPIKGLKIAL